MIQIGFLNIIYKVNQTALAIQKDLLFFFVVGRSPKKSPSQRKSRKPDSDVDGASGTGAASSENDE